MAKPMIRQGGRSARIQQAVHDAVRHLLSTHDRSEITVPMISEQAGVTPSTIYRRWGDLAEVLADVAAERMRPQTDPTDHGSQYADVEAWALQYAEEMASPVGRQMLADIFVRAGENTYSTRCCEYTYQQLEVMSQRAATRGETPFSVAEVIDRVVSPVVYHILFGDREVTPDYCRELIAIVSSLAQAKDETMAT